MRKIIDKFLKWLGCKTCDKTNKENKELVNLIVGYEHQIACLKEVINCLEKENKALFGVNESLRKIVAIYEEYQGSRERCAN